MEHIDEIIEMVEQAAAEMRDTAACNGEWNDGGAGKLLELVKFYNYGRKAVIPPEWEEYEQEYKNKHDPEFQEYLRLKQKFE